MFLHPFFKNIVFRSVALVIKKLWAILDFFLYKLQTFYRPVPYPMRNKKKNYSVTNERARAKKLQGGGAKRPPPQP